MIVLGWIITVIGAITSVVSITNYSRISNEIAAWYYYRSSLESYRTILFIGLTITVIGIIILLAAYLKKKN